MTFLSRSSRLQLSCYKNHSSVVSPSFIMLPLYISSSRPGCCPPGPLVAAALYNLIIAPQYLPARLWTLRPQSTCLPPTDRPGGPPVGPAPRVQGVPIRFLVFHLFVNWKRNIFIWNQIWKSWGPYCLHPEPSHRLHLVPPLVVLPGEDLPLADLVSTFVLQLNHELYNEKLKGNQDYNRFI